MCSNQWRLVRFFFGGALRGILYAWLTERHRGSAGPSQKIWDFLSAISCILVHFG